MAISFGIKTSQINATYSEILGVWQDADEIEAFDSAWLWDHLVPMRGDVTAPALEAWTLLSALAAIAEREYGAYGIDVVPVKEAIGALGEALTITRRLWTERTPFDFDGEHYQLTGAICEPKPAAVPPILIGAGGEKRSLRLVAQHADIWNCPTRGDVEEYRRKSRILDEHCNAVGRDPGAIARQVQILVSGDPADAPETLEHIRALIDAGAGQIVLTPLPPWPDKIAARLAETIVAPLM